MASPPVSIIIPCYNAVHYIADAIRSALDQSYPNKEIIVIDDGSTDGSLDVIRSFGACIRWETGPNRGGSAARNRGLELAQGEFIQFLDADDILFPEKLAEQVVEAVKRPGTIITCDRYNLLPGEKGGRQEQVSIEPPRGDILAWAVGRTQLLGISSSLHVKEGLANVGAFDENLPCSQEYDLHIRLAAHGFPFWHLRRPLWIARRVPGSVSSDSERVYDQHERIFDRASKAAATHGLYSERASGAMAVTLMADARYYSLTGLRSKARKHIKLAQKYHGTAWIAHYDHNRLLKFAASLFGPCFVERLVRWRRQWSFKLN